ncbi:MAG: major capsid protein [Microviridae sp.]|nr:MAG: major capsid protein [Microviridae sp.]
MARNIFDGVQGNNPRLNKFDLSHSHLFSAKVGLLYPVMCQEVYPGDVFKITDAVYVQVTPMVAPLMSDLDMYCHTFFVPYRLIYGIDTSDGKPIWEKFITGGEEGDYATPLPEWRPNWSKTSFSSDTIWDSIGNPVKYTPNTTGFPTWTPLVPDASVSVSIAPKRAYNFIWNSFYRDENLQEELDLDNEDLVYPCFRKDYFTSALEAQQRGTAPAIPISGVIPVNFPNFGEYGTQVSLPNGQIGPTANQMLMAVIQDNAENPNDPTHAGLQMRSANTPYVYKNLQLEGTVDLQNATTFNVSDLRLAFAIQRMQELNMRAGVRYTEFLRAHFGVSPTDARLDRPEYIGGCVFPINVSPTVQTSATTETSPQGNKAGIASAVDAEYIGGYRAQEYGLIMTLMSIRPKPSYQQGIARQWLRKTRFDYYSPEFANLSEQAVLNAELYVDPEDGKDGDIFGYQAHWNELRCAQNLNTGAVREQFDYYTFGRKFASRPALNGDFVSLDHPTEYSRVFAVQNEDQFVVAFTNGISAYRPIPAYGVPGLIDHVYGGL